MTMFFPSKFPSFPSKGIKSELNGEKHQLGIIKAKSVDSLLFRPVKGGSWKLFMDLDPQKDRKGIYPQISQIYTDGEAPETGDC